MVSVDAFLFRDNAIAWILYTCIFSLSLFLRFYLFFRERRRDREREGEQHQGVVASRTPPTGDLACNPNMCPDWEWNRQPFGLQASTQSTEPHLPGRIFSLLHHQLDPLFLLYFQPSPLPVNVIKSLQSNQEPMQSRIFSRIFLLSS